MSYEKMEQSLKVEKTVEKTVEKQQQQPRIIKETVIKGAVGGNASTNMFCVSDIPPEISKENLGHIV